MLLSFGARLVADDRTCLWREGADLMACAPTSISGAIEARGVGLLNAQTLPEAAVALVVDMDHIESARLPPHRSTDLLDCVLPVLHKVDSAYFPAAVLQYLRHGPWTKT